jgi:hypothetical protein
VSLLGVKAHCKGSPIVLEAFPNFIHYALERGQGMFGIKVYCEGSPRVLRAFTNIVPSSRHRLRDHFVSTDSQNGLQITFTVLTQ